MATTKDKFNNKQDKFTIDGNAIPDGKLGNGWFNYVDTIGLMAQNFSNGGLQTTTKDAVGAINELFDKSTKLIIKYTDVTPQTGTIDLTQWIKTDQDNIDYRIEALITLTEESTGDLIVYTTTDVSTFKGRDGIEMINYNINTSNYQLIMNNNGKFKVNYSRDNTTLKKYLAKVSIWKTIRY